MTTPPASSKRHTLERLLATARQAFADKGLAGARVEEIAREAGVTKQLVYHYYGSKENLFASVLDDASQRVMAHLLACKVEHLTPVDALRTLLQECFDQYAQDPLLGPLAQEGIRFHDAHASARNHFTDLSPTLVAKFERILHQGSAKGDFVDGIEPRLFLATAALLTSGTFTNRYSMSVLMGVDTRSPEGVERWREHSVNFILAGIRARPV